jgi:hypothetical protein
MNRGMQQVLLNYLPGKTFDFEKIGTIARVDRIRGVPNVELNAFLILRAIDDYARTWAEDYRPIFRDLERSVDRFVLVEPRGVEAAMFPLVFWCQNPRCGSIVETRDEVPRAEACTVCRTGRLVQLRFVRVHRCGELAALTSQTCTKCRSPQKMALDTRGSERISDFQWICRSCGHTAQLFAGRCPACDWTGGDPALKNMSVEVFRAGRTFYPHYTVLLNQPGRELTAFLAVPRWQAVAASAFFGLPELGNRRLVDYARTAGSQTRTPFALSETERARLRAQGTPEEMIAQFEKMQAQLQTSRVEAEAVGSPDGIAAALVRRSGVPLDVWERAGQEMLEAVMPVQAGTVTGPGPQEDPEGDDGNRAVESAKKRLGLESVVLATDFPITTATFGYSRVDYQPDTCRLNPFPPDPDHGGKFPIFVDVVQADAVLLRLDHEAVLRWLALNRCSPTLPAGEDAAVSSKAYFVRLLDGVALRQTIHAREARLVFGLLHTLSHLAVRRAALLCGLEGTSLSEYVLPRTLTCALYCNHRFGATIGALSALFEQSLAEWLGEIRSSRRCVYDPVCIDRGGTCHACTHLAETSCRFFNLNLGRPFLFGGRDVVVGDIDVGFLDPLGMR